MQKKTSFDIGPWHSQVDEFAMECAWERTEELPKSAKQLAEEERRRTHVCQRATRRALLRAELLHDEVAKDEDSLDDAEATVAKARWQPPEALQSLAVVGLMAAGAGIMLVGSGPVAFVAGATTLAGGSVSMAASWGGIACHASVREGRTSGIELNAVRAMIMVEKGPGRCFYFAYGSQEEAMHDLDASFAKLTSRILFTYQNGSLKEVCTKGAPFALNTIRRAAKSFERVTQFSEREDL